MNAPAFGIGSLVRARGRDWVVLPGSAGTLLRLRPLGGADEDGTVLDTRLEPADDRPRPATFAPPDSGRPTDQEGALLLRDALLLSLRRGGGPFRSFGNIAVEPRPYQLVPLLMALKLPVVRLLIADDVGIGKTIEAALIARELLDRGDIARFAVLCPPHLVDQWVRALDRHFQLRAAAVTAASAARLERDLPAGESIFGVHPFTVVSLDYIKSERRRDDFVRACPEFVIVDEAHACTLQGAGRQQRFELLRRLAGDANRHMALLTATPHSGNETAFFNLLSLLDPEFAGLGAVADDARHPLRERLGRHFVQRRRIDIEQWQGTERLFPRRLVAELDWPLAGPWRDLVFGVLDYARDVVEAAGGDERRQRLNFWSTLALLRCVSSSPAAAAQALRTHAARDEPDEDDLRQAALDGDGAEAGTDDETPATPADARLARLLKLAESLQDTGADAKLEKLAAHLRELVAKGFSPIIFCRYIATAKYLAARLDKLFADHRVVAVTGEMPADARELAVRELAGAERRILVATDCLSEGIDLQDGFDAVVHYDLSWNPTRHEQREGRVDRFGQRRPEVRATLMYGSDNPVDAAVLQVILRKAARIRRELGVPVPVPESGDRLTRTLMQAVLVRDRDRGQGQLDFGAIAAAAADFETEWKDAEEREKRNRTIFAQNSIKPAEVMPEWDKAQAALGGPAEVRRFAGRALARLGAAPVERARGGWRIALAPLAEDLRERLVGEGLEGELLADTAEPPAPGCARLHRAHPLIATLADGLLGRALAADDIADAATLGRCGCWISGAVQKRTVIALLRLRHQLDLVGGATPRQMLAEEAVLAAWTGTDAVPDLADAGALAALQAPASGDVAPTVLARELARALALLDQAAPALERLAQSRAEALLADHRRVRDAAEGRGRYTIRPLLPADAIGLFVLLPEV